MRTSLVTPLAAAFLSVASYASAEPLPPPQPPPPGVSPAAPAQPAQAAPAPAGAAANPPPVTVQHARPRPGAQDRDDSDGGRDLAPPPSSGFQLALRLGASIPFGSAYKTPTTGKDVSMSDTTGVHFMPLFVDIGGKLSEHFFLGAMLGIGAGPAKDANGDSNGNLVSGIFGIELLYFFAPAEKVNPWIGYGLAAEVLSGKIKNTDTTVSFNGVRFADLQGGVDFRLSKLFGIGPFASVAISQYSTFKIDDGKTSSEVSLDKALHGWFTLGVKGTFFP